MVINCIDLIREKYSYLNRAQKKIGQYILDNPEKAMKMNIVKLAKESQVSVSTIFRFCKSLGFDGFQDFKITLANSVTKPISNIYSEITPSDGPYIIMQKIISGYEYSLKQTLMQNDEAQLLAFSESLKEAGKVYILGLGGSFPYAEDAVHKFTRNGIDCQAINDIHWAYMKVSLAKEDDLLVVFSSSGANKDLIEIIEYARKKKLKILSITTKKDSRIASLSDISLVSFGREYTSRSEAFESRVSTLLIIDCLFLILLLQDEGENNITKENLAKIREAISLRRIEDI